MRSSIFISFTILICSIGSVYGQDSTSAEYFKKGEYHLSNADYEIAVVQFSKAIAMDASDPNFFLQRGFCFNILKKHEEAIADFSSAIALAPDNKFAYLSRGSAKNKTGQFESAIIDFNKVLDLDPNDQEAFNNRGFSKKELGDSVGACEDWKKSKKLGNKEAPIILKNNHCK
ncbi:MAG: tetratricopeptide repeat protein [Bacteroidota bacterium]